MAYKFNIYSVLMLGLASIVLAVLMSVPSIGYGDILEEMCQPDGDASFDLNALVVEAEATGMPSSTLNRLLLKGYQDKTSSRELSRLLCTIILAEEGGLDPGMLFAKLDEGLGKRATLSRIASVIENKVGDMKFAQRLLSGDGEPKLEDDNVTRIAAVLATGISRSELTTLFTEYPDTPANMRVVAAEITAYGGIIGYNAQLLAQIVNAGLKSRAFSDEWAFLIKVISKARKKNISDKRIATVAVKTLSKKGALNQLIAALGMTPGEVY